jgi:hypothetical protein
VTSGAGSRFCRPLLNAWPREWTHRYATFIWPDLNLDVMLVVADGRELYRDTLDHLGVALPGKGAVIDACHRAVALGVPFQRSRAPRGTARRWTSSGSATPTAR